MASKKRSTVSLDKPLNPQQELFVTEYLVDFCAYKAYIRAGYSERQARGCSSRLLADPRIQKRIAEVKAQMAEKLELSPDTVMRRWSDMLRVLSQEVLAFDSSGAPIERKDGEQATKYIDPHALRNVLRDVAQAVGMFDKKEDESTKLQNTTGVLRVAAPMSKEDWLEGEDDES